MTNVFKKKKLMLLMVTVLCLLIIGTGFVLASEDEEDGTIVSGVYIGGINVSGMTAAEAQEAVETYVETLSGANVNLVVGENVVAVSAGGLGFSIEMQDVYEEAAGLCKKGNIVKRYKDKKHLEEEGMNYDLVYKFDETKVREVIEQQCKVYDQPAVNASIKRVNGVFEIVDGVIGYELDVDASVKTVLDFLEADWSPDNTEIALSYVETRPKGTREELGKVKDLLATATTSYSTSGANRRGNVERGASLINGTVLYPGEEFSCYGTVSPISVENGYFMAASYAEGQVVESAGGGICQVSTTLYNAVLKAELDVTQRSNHSMIVTYVDPAMDAAIAGTYKDLKFVNNTEAPIYIEGITAGKKITFNIYGMETRSSSRTVEFVSETVSETEPAVEIKVDAGSAFGTISKESAHKGIVAKLWKVVKENGTEVSRTEVNQSKYNMSPERYTIGTANASAEALNELNTAVGMQDINLVKAVIVKYGMVATTAPVVDGDVAAEGNVGGEATVQQPAQQQEQTVDTQTPATTQQQPASTPDTTVTTEIPQEETPQPDATLTQ